ncbi:MurR/RpiR family transcriptional regulator [Sphaerisporangium sp. NPDC051011]|uniref:MurR/RpiR family transcriptional regulator n=1 Tax=Sphaerisporangium sp. NPDC051011 TaxID=3155792 RepID=UPI003402D474
MSVAGGAATSSSVAERIRGRMGQLSAGERKVARALLAHYPSAGLGSTHELAQRAGVSAPTVVRFVAHLEFDGYREFQQALRDEVQERRASPLTIPQRITKDDLRAVSARVFTEAVEQTYASLPDEELDKAVDLLADTSRHITCFGGRYSHLLAAYLDLHLRQMRPGTTVHPQTPTHHAGFLLDVGKRDVCVVFDFRRYQRDVVDLAVHAHDRGAKILLITDPWLSPAAEVADLVLPVRVDGPSPFDSIVPATAIVESIVAGVLAKLGERAETRIREADELAGNITFD